MARVTPLISDFTAGELAPYLYGRTDQPVYYKGASLLSNFMPRPQGGFRKRPGTLFVGRTQGDQSAKIFSIKISASLSYLFELTNQLIRIWKFSGDRLTLLPPANNLNVPYVSADIQGIQTAWLYPDLFISHQNYPPSRIRYLGNDTFSFQNINFVTTTYTFTANTVLGSNVLTVLSTTNLPSAAGAGIWSLTGAGIPAGTYLTQIYPSATPTLNISAMSATMNNNATLNGTAVTLTLSQLPLPFQGSGNYPRCVACAFERVWWANTLNNPQTLWASIVGVWDSNDPTGALGNMNMNLFEATTYPLQSMVVDASGNPTTNPPQYQNVQQTQNAIADSDAIQIALSETESEILWIAPGVDLVVGTADGELVIPSTSTANNVASIPVSKAGSMAIQGTQLSNGVIFVQEAGRVVFELNWQGTLNPRTPPRPLSFFSGHLFQGNQITAFDFCQAPDMYLYFLRQDGSLAVMLYETNFNVMAWWQMVTRSGDSIQSIAVLSASNRDCLVTCVTRGAFNYIELQFDADWTDVRLASYMDCTTFVHNVAPASTIAVDSSFNGVTMGVVADGKYLGTAVPSAGVVTLPGGATGNYLMAGLLYTATMKTMPIVPQADYGTSILKIKGEHYVRLQFINTLDCQTNIDGGPPMYPANFQNAPNINVANPTPYTGADKVPIDVDWNMVSVLDVQSSNPLPCEVTAIVPEVAVAPE